jgi:hypothetical protein
MRQEPEGHDLGKGDRVAPSTERGATGGKLFPYQTVVGVVDDPAELEAAVQALVSNGFDETEVHVLCGARGVEQIDAKGKRKGLLARLFRIVDALGEEREHTARHVEELESGHFVVVVDAHDEGSKTRAREALAAHGGHFINFYSRLSTEDLAP